MTEFEYKVISVDQLPAYLDRTETVLNLWGKDGWEAFHADYDPGIGRQWIWFKRQKKNPGGMANA